MHFANAEGRQASNGIVIDKSKDTKLPGTLREARLLLMGSGPEGLLHPRGEQLFVFYRCLSECQLYFKPIILKVRLGQATVSYDFMVGKNGSFITRDSVRTFLYTVELFQLQVSSSSHSQGPQ